MLEPIGGNVNEVATEIPDAALEGVGREPSEEPMPWPTHATAMTTGGKYANIDQNESCAIATVISD